MMPLIQTANFPESSARSGASSGTRNGAHDSDDCDVGSGATSTEGSWALWQIEESEEALLNLLDPSLFSLEELYGIKVAQRRLEWLACRIALQSLLSRFQGGRLQKNEHGRPYLHDCGWHVSLSHAYPFAAAAAHPTRPVGIDLEQPRAQLLRIKNKFLSQEEQAWVGNDLRQLCLCWTAKEALYKLHGQPGLIFAKDMHVISANAADPLQALLKGDLYNLYFQWHNDLLLCIASQHY